MTAHWKELLAPDYFSVHIDGFLHDYDRKVLTLLYQPLIGALSYSLYMTLWSLVEPKQFDSVAKTHHSLMNMMNCSLKTIYEERLKLEGIGLLNVYVKDDSEHKEFIYELKPPLTPRAFFQDDETLAICLYNRLGEKNFDLIKKQVLMSKPPVDGFKNVTKDFGSVFTPIQAEEVKPYLSNETEAAFIPSKDQVFMDRHQNESFSILETQVAHFDYHLFIEDVSSLIAVDQVMTKEAKEAILKLAFIYHIDALEMSGIVQRVCIYEDTLNLEELRKEVARWYQFEHEQALPYLTLRRQPEGLKQVQKKENMTKEEKAVLKYETLSPYELLEQWSGGKPASADLKIVEAIMMDQNLMPGVVNVLVDYVLTINDGKLPKAYIEKIAAHWARKKIKTVKEAMVFARGYQQEIKEKKKERKQVRTNKPNAMVKKDILPKWMTEKEEKVDVKNFEQKKQALEARLKKWENRSQ